MTEYESEMERRKRETLAASGIGAGNVSFGDMEQKSAGSYSAPGSAMAASKSGDTRLGQPQNRAMAPGSRQIFDQAAATAGQAYDSGNVAKMLGAGASMAGAYLTAPVEALGNSVSDLASRASKLGSTISGTAGIAAEQLASGFGASPSPTGRSIQVAKAPLLIPGAANPFERVDAPAMSPAAPATPGVDQANIDALRASRYNQAVQAQAQQLPPGYAQTSPEQEAAFRQMDAEREANAMQVQQQNRADEQNSRLNAAYWDAREYANRNLSQADGAKFMAQFMERMAPLQAANNAPQQQAVARRLEGMQADKRMQAQFDQQMGLAQFNKNADNERAMALAKAQGENQLMAVREKIAADEAARAEKLAMAQQELNTETVKETIDPITKQPIQEITRKRQYKGDGAPSEAATPAAEIPTAITQQLSAALKKNPSLDPVVLLSSLGVKSNPRDPQYLALLEHIASLKGAK